MTELENILTQSIRRRNQLLKKLEYWQNKSNSKKAEQFYSQLWVENANIEYCKEQLGQQQ